MIIIEKLSYIINQGTPNYSGYDVKLLVFVFYVHVYFVHIAFMAGGG
jgi:hypothetical protein